MASSFWSNLSTIENSYVPVCAGDNWLESSSDSAEEDHEVNNKLMKDQQGIFMASSIQDSIRMCGQQVERGDPSPEFHTGEATSGDLGPVMGSLVQEEYEHPGKSSAKGHRNGEGSGASLL